MISKNCAAKKATRESQWRQKIQEWDLSGLSQAKFSELHKINPCTFSYWKRRLQNKNEIKQENGPSFLPLSIIQEEHSALNARASGLSVTIQNRITINIDEQFSKETFLQVVQVLEEL